MISLTWFEKIQIQSKFVVACVGKAWSDLLIAIGDLRIKPK